MPGMTQQVVERATACGLYLRTVGNWMIRFAGQAGEEYLAECQSEINNTFALISSGQPLTEFAQPIADTAPAVGTSGTARQNTPTGAQQKILGWLNAHPQGGTAQDITAGTGAAANNAARSLGALVKSGAVTLSGGVYRLTAVAAEQQPQAAAA